MTNAPLRFTFVIARYGAHILGGAERHARSVAERLAARGHDVRVLTSCARSYMTWDNEIPPGTTVEGGVAIERYRAGRGRVPGDQALKWLSSALPRISSVARAWARAQGPIVPELLARLPEEARDRDLLVFFQLLAYPTLFGMPKVAHKSVLVPLVHKEWAIDTTFARQMLTLPRALLVNTTREADTISALVGSDGPPMRVVAVGLEPPGPTSPERLPSLPGPYVTFIGRIGKLKPLLRTWRTLTTCHSLPPLCLAGQSVPWSDVHLVVVGERSSSASKLRNVVQTGYVDDATRWTILRGAVALINPSLYESLSLVLLEAWTAARPVVVNAHCDVTADLVQRSGGGLVADFSNPDGAAAAIAAGLQDEARRVELGRRGEAFASATFVWDRVLDEYEAAAREVTSVL